MRSFLRIVFSMSFIIFSCCGYGQLWKQYADSAKMFNDQKNIKKAIEYYYKVKTELPKDSIETINYTRLCNIIANLSMDLSQYQQAESLYLESKRIRAKIIGKRDPEYAASCAVLGRFYRIMGQYQKAEPLLLEAKQIREKVFGKDHSQYALSCNGLAVLYFEKSEYEKAESLYLEAKQVWEKSSGKNNPDYISSCNNLANLYSKMAKYEKAELLYLEAKQIWEKIFNKEDSDYASICNNLANFYCEIGEYEKAETLYLQAKQIREELLGKLHPEYAKSCFNLALLYYDIAEYQKAESFHLEAKQIREKIFGKKDPSYAESCNGLAALYGDMGQNNKAEPLYLEAKQIWEKIFGKEHPDYAQVCYNLANLYLKANKYTKADFFYLSANQIDKNIYGEEHPNYTESCNSLANFYRITGLAGKANIFYIKSFQSRNSQMKKIFQFANEVEKLSYIKKNADYERNLFSFYMTNYSPINQGFSYNVSIFERNLILFSLQQLRNAIYSIADTNIRNKYNNWINIRKQLAYWSTELISDQPSFAASLQEQSNILEKELTRLSASFKKDQENKDITWKNIQQNLKPNEAAIEFVEFDYYDGKRWTDSTFYVGLVLRKDKPEPILVRLFEKKQLDTLLNSNENSSINERINFLYKQNSSLYNLIWKPLEKYLNGISKIYFASAGDLFKISFAALPVNDKQLLGDKYQLIQLNTTASVVNKDETLLNNNDKIQLYGGIKYDADSTALKQAIVSYQSNTETKRSLPDDLKRGAGFQYLPGTQQETDEINKQAVNAKISVTILNGVNATEESIKALTGKASPSVLHIATHGFFFPDPKEDKMDDIQRRFETSGKVFRQSDNPLFRSGLLFAGANYAWNGKPVEGIEDGILTAYEVSNMYLPDTKLVVLSACETALGDIQGSEGVYGLQRAFKMAGIQNLVMSLWKVPDEETSEFMQLFYKNLFAKQNISDAFYNAQRTMKNKYRNEPYKWAAWVLVR